MSKAAALRIATRGSPLALVQAQAVADSLGDAEIVVIKTEGDRRTDVPLSELGGRGVFTTEVQAAVLDGRADIAVHSAKDLPSSAELQIEGLVLAAVPERADVRDCLIGSTLAGLREGATVGTGSPRRRVVAGAPATRSHVRRPARQHRDTTRPRRRARRLGRHKAAGCNRRCRGRADNASGSKSASTEAFDPGTFVPQVGQGALAVECRTDDDMTRQRLIAIDDADAHRACVRSAPFLARLGGGCDAPVGAYAMVVEGGRLHLTGLLANAEGSVATVSSTGDDPLTLGALVADELLEIDW